MSTEGPALLDPQAAYEFLHREIYAPTFFDKLASYGIQPANEAERTELLRMGHAMRKRRDATAKAATHQTGIRPFLAEVSNSLREELQSSGFGHVVDAPVQAAVKRAAHNAALNPQVANAVLSLQLSGQLRAQQGQ